MNSPIKRALVALLIAQKRAVNDTMTSNARRPPKISIAGGVHRTLGPVGQAIKDALTNRK
jgi:hypothetical protein